MRTIEDHSPCQYEQHRDATLLLSAPEYAELQDSPWLREATEEEIEAEMEMIKEREDLLELMEFEEVPYKWVTVLRSAPGHIWRQSTGHLRLSRFKEEG